MRELESEDAEDKDVGELHVNVHIGSGIVYMSDRAQKNPQGKADNEPST